MILVGDELETHWNEVVNKGDGHRVEIRSRLLTTELKAHQVDMGILRDNVFGATPPLQSVRLLRSLMMTESKQANSYKPMFNNTS